MDVGVGLAWGVVRLRAADVGLPSFCASSTPPASAANRIAATSALRIAARLLRLETFLVTCPPGVSGECGGTGAGPLAGLPNGIGAAGGGCIGSPGATGPLAVAPGSVGCGRVVSPPNERAVGSGRVLYPGGGVGLGGVIGAGWGAGGIGADMPIGWVPRESCSGAVWQAVAKAVAKALMLANRSAGS